MYSIVYVISKDNVISDVRVSMKLYKEEINARAEADRVKKFIEGNGTTVKCIISYHW